MKVFFYATENLKDGEVIISALIFSSQILSERQELHKHTSNIFGLFLFENVNLSKFCEL